LKDAGNSPTIPTTPQLRKAAVLTCLEAGSHKKDYGMYFSGFAKYSDNESVNL
jgi:hypothetical protein